MEQKIKIKEGFVGGRLIVAPLLLLQKSEQNSLINNLLIHSIGYYPNAKHHYFERQNGCSEYILIYCTKGEGWVDTAGARHTLKVGDFIVIPQEIAHKYGASDSDAWSIYWTHFKGEKAAEFYAKLANVNSLIVEDGSRVEDRKKSFDELINVLDGDMSLEKYEYACLALNQLLASFIHPKSYQAALFDNAKTKTSSFINLASHYMHENIDKKITLKDISSHFGYSESYFYRLFHAQTGCSPISYFLQLKIYRCCQLLQHTNLKINQISCKVGFESPLYFSRYFKMVMGLPPKEYRKSHSKIIF